MTEYDNDVNDDPWVELNIGDVTSVVTEYVRIELRNGSLWEGTLIGYKTNSHRKLTHLEMMGTDPDHNITLNVSDRRRRVAKLWVLEEA